MGGRLTGKCFRRRWRSRSHPTPPESKQRDLAVSRPGPGQILLPAESTAPRWVPKLHPVPPGPDPHGMGSVAGGLSKMGTSPPTVAWTESDELPVLEVRRGVRGRAAAQLSLSEDDFGQSETMWSFDPQRKHFRRPWLLRLRFLRLPRPRPRPLPRPRPRPPPRVLPCAFR